MKDHSSRLALDFETVQKITKAGRGSSVDQVVEYLPRKLEAPSSNSISSKK
jgi:hypothetical protein